MRSTAVIILLCMLTSAGRGQNLRSNFPVYNASWLLIYGPDQSASMISSNHISTEKIYDYTIRNNSIKDSSLLRTILYDDHGNIIQKVSGAKKKITTELYSYDSTSRLIRKSYDCTCEKSLPHITEYKFEAGRPYTRYIHDSDTSAWFEDQLYYNTEYQLTKRYQKINKSEFIYEKYSYDEKGREVQTDILDAAGNTLYSFLFAYDEEKRTKNTTRVSGNYSYVADNDEYNDKWQLIRKWHGSDYIDYIYNADGTLYEASVMYRGNASLLRHYYFRN